MQEMMENLSESFINPLTGDHSSSKNFSNFIYNTVQT